MAIILAVLIGTWLITTLVSSQAYATSSHTKVNSEKSRPAGVLLPVQAKVSASRKTNLKVPA
ncbi:MAG: hypothetical protein AAF821_16445 [Cyanobacteria bacterium P01_D01_bin.156]